MKKLIVFGLAAIAAVAANAASFYWSLNNVQKVDGNSSVGTEGVGIEKRADSLRRLFGIVDNADDALILQTAVVAEEYAPAAFQRRSEFFVIL